MIWSFIPYIVGVLVGVLSFVATEFFFVINQDDPVARSQKHFWSIIFAIFGVVFSMSIAASDNVSSELAKLTSENLPTKIDDLKADINTLINSNTSLEQIVSDYHSHFGQVNRCMKRWSEESFEAFDKDLRSGWIDLGGSKAPGTLSAEYDDAQSDIVATNVGSITYYFKNQTYIDANQNVATPERHVPVIRFFLYGKSMTDVGTFADYVDHATGLSHTLKTLCSIVINTDTLGLAPDDLHDYLLVDRSFVAQTIQSDEATWTLQSARASEESSNVKDASNYLSSLYGLSKEGPAVKFVCLSDPEVHSYFSASHFFPKESRTQLARTMYRSIMKGVTQTGTVNENVITASSDGREP